MTITNVYGSELAPKAKELIISNDPTDDIKGVLFPLFDKIQGRGIFRSATNLDLFKSNIIQFIKTERGERVMLPNFGLSLRRFLFSPIDDDLTEAIATEIVYGLKRYLPNVVVRDLNIIENNSKISGFGLPGIKILLSVSPSNAASVVNITIDL